jgi:hypothetical protein
MSRRNSAFWLLVLSGVLMIAMIVSMNMLAEVDPSVTAILSIRAHAARMFAGSHLAHRFEPPIEHEVGESEQRTRGLILSIPVSQEEAQDARLKERRLREGADLLASGIRLDNTLDQVINWYQIELVRGDLPPEQRGEPVQVQRHEHTPRPDRFNRFPQKEEEPR